MFFGLGQPWWDHPSHRDVTQVPIENINGLNRTSTESHVFVFVFASHLQVSCNFSHHFSGKKLKSKISISGTNMPACPQMAAKANPQMSVITTISICSLSYPCTLGISKRNLTTFYPTIPDFNVCRLR